MVTFILAALLLSDVAVPLVHDGRAGVWLELKTARDANECMEKQPLIERKLKLLSDDSMLATREILELRASLGTAMEQNALVQASLERAISRAEAWWRSPALWAALGAVTALAGVLVIQ